MKSIFSILLLILSITPFTFATTKSTDILVNDYNKFEVKIQLALEDQEDGTAYLLESSSPSHNWLFIYPDKWGVTNEVKNDAYRLWMDLKNVNVLIIDLNDGINPIDNKEAMRLLIKNDVERDHAIIQSAINYTGDHAKIGSLGWCYGGSWSLQTAIKAKEKEVACVMYYGMPETNTKMLKNLNSDVLAIYGSMDTYITPTIANYFKEKMASVGKNVLELTYEGKGEFADRNSTKYNQDYALNAYSKVLEYLHSKYN